MSTIIGIITGLSPHTSIGKITIDLREMVYLNLELKS